MKDNQLYRAVPVAERLPEKEGFYWVWKQSAKGNKAQEGDYWKGGKWEFEKSLKVTHWLEPIEAKVYTEAEIEDIKKAEADSIRQVYAKLSDAHQKLHELELVIYGNNPSEKTQSTLENLQKTIQECENILAYDKISHSSSK